MAASAACDLAVPILARYNLSKSLGGHPLHMVWSEVSRKGL
jgi:hypothetical protein